MGMGKPKATTTFLLIAGDPVGFCSFTGVSERDT